MATAMAVFTEKIIRRKWGNELKRKLVVKTLALLLTGVMVMEIPMQSYAAEAAAVTQEASADGAESSEVTEEPVVEEPAAEEPKAEEPTAEEPAAEEPKVEESTVEKPKAEEPTTETPANEPKTEASAEEKPSEEVTPKESEVTVEETVDAQDAVAASEDVAAQAAVFEDVTVEARQFGNKKMNLDGFEAEQYSAAVEKVKNALSKKEGTVTFTPSTPKDKITKTELKDIISYILESAYDNGDINTYETLLPTVNCVVDKDNVVTAVFNYASNNYKVHIDSVAWEGDTLKVKYGNDASVASAVQLVQIPVKADGTLDWDAKSVNDDLSSTATEYSYQPTPGNYKFILLGKKDDKVTTYSVLSELCSYSLPQVTGVSIKAVDKEGITIGWDKLGSAERYQVIRTNKNTSAVRTFDINSADTTSYKDTEMEADATYTYQVKAFRTMPYEEGSWESLSESAESVSPKANLAVSAISFASPSSDQATLNWNTADGASGYELYVCNNGTYQYQTDVYATSWQLTGLEAGRNYQYAVLPFRQTGNVRAYGTMSDTVNVKTSLASTGIQAVAAAYNQINLAWAQIPQADGYEIYRDGQWYQTVWGGNNCSFADTAIACGTTYTYKVRPLRNVDGAPVYGEFSVDASAVTSLPGTSVNAVSSVEYQTMDISWNQGTGAQGYELYRSAVSGADYGLLSDITDGNTTFYRDGGLAVGQTWFYKVKPYRWENGQKVYGPESNEMSGQVTLGTVTGVNAWATQFNKIQISWNKMPQATGYEIYYSTSPDSGYTFLKKLGKGAKKFTFTKALCGTTYYFQVRPFQKVKKNMNYGSFSSAASAMTVIGTPTLSLGKVTYSSIQLKWKNVKGAKSFNIYYSDSENGNYQFLMNTKKKNVNLKDLETGKHYYYKLAAVRDNYTSDLSNAVSAVPSMGKLTGVSASSVSSTELKISWKKLKGTEKYVILRSDRADGAYTEIGSTDKSSYTDKNLPNSTTYFYKVYPVRGNYHGEQVGPVNAKTRDAGSINTKEDKKSVYYGIDVSSYQGSIDWNAVANDGIDFAMIRILTGKDASAINYDSRFKENYKGARAAGLYVGVYRYSYATSVSKARKEAKAIVEALDGRKLDYPIVMDMEDSSILQSTSNAKRTDMILAFKEVVEDAGYKFALYANKTWLDNYIDTGRLGNTHIWMARWRDLEKGHGYSNGGTLTMWQYSNKGSVKGISGTVDLDVSYKKYQ